MGAALPREHICDPVMEPKLFTPSLLEATGLVNPGRGCEGAERITETLNGLG